LAHRVDGYSFGEIIIDGKPYHHDVIIYKDNILDWWRSESHRVSVNDADKIIQLKPQTIIFGTGDAGVMQVPRETLDYLEKLGIKVLLYKTEEAGQKYNEMSEGDLSAGASAEADVAAALHLTC
jgi:hypothetical protein